MLEEELRYVELCRAGLRRMLDGARHNVIVGESVAGDRYSAERLGRHLKSLVKQLSEEPEGPPFFGRLDFGPGGEHAGRAYHIGRRHIPGEHGGVPVVIDWRAPVSRAFYRASAREPMGVAVRRRFGWSHLTLTGFEDERLAEGQQADSKILAAEIERPRVGPMRDIVATIQPEQDDLVRAGLEETICVQGAPGTGKTAVGLHRAAFLLYAHRKRLQRSGVLVLGPNRAFLGYISAVLPALGEVDVEQTTLTRLLATVGAKAVGTQAVGAKTVEAKAVEVRAVDAAAAAAIKHDPRMARLLREALYGRIAKPVEPVTVADGSYRWRVAEGELRRIVEQARRDGTPYGIGRERVRARVVSLMRRQAEARGQSVNAAWDRRVGRALNPFLEAVWPAVKPQQVLYEVLSAPADDGVLSRQERAAITWAKPARSFNSARWSAADLVLLDELGALIERPRGYGHVIVDEAQDLSPMECRAIARRCEHGSLTVLGDLAQGTTAWAATGWRERLELMGKPEGRVISLTTGFRVPASVVELANRLLDRLGVDVPQTRSYRFDGRLRLTPVASLADGVAAAVEEALGFEGSVGVIAADEAVEEVRAAVPEAGQRLSVVAASMVKGLEYDHVIVAEPAAIVAAEERGLNRLYVALTRAVSRLDLVHALPLPAELGAGSTASSGPRSDVGYGPAN